jgi:proline dehydrogenase
METLLDFEDTATAFEIRTDEELKKMEWLFEMMANPKITRILGKIGSWAVSARLPFVEKIMLKTLFYQFCGGRTLLEAQQVIEKLSTYGVKTILDYGVEGKSKEEDLNHTMNELIRAIEFAKGNPSIPFISVKLTGLIKNEILETISSQHFNIQYGEADHLPGFKNFIKRIDAICYAGQIHQVKIAIDAEESWIQNAIDQVADLMMHRYNQKEICIYNTFQLYRTDRLDFLKKSFDKSVQFNYHLGAKLVRGAYMEKERKRAIAMNYPSPIHTSKENTDRDFNAAVTFCLHHCSQMGLINASHNTESCQLQAVTMQHLNLPAHHPNLLFSQLMGMSDNLTFGLAKAGYNVSKYIVYGQVREVIPYLVRRSEENTSVTGELSRELKLIKKELKRRHHLS